LPKNNQLDFRYFSFQLSFILNKTNMEKTKKLYCPNTCNIFEMQFGFAYPVAAWTTMGRKDTRTKAHGKQRVELNKNN